jgi:hypothetical protein
VAATADSDGAAADETAAHRHYDEAIDEARHRQGS